MRLFSLSLKSIRSMVQERESASGSSFFSCSLMSSLHLIFLPLTYIVGIFYMSFFIYLHLTGTRKLI